MKKLNKKKKMQPRGLEPMSSKHLGYGPVQPIKGSAPAYWWIIYELYLETGRDELSRFS
jgi:hypothetical protein